MSREAIIRPLFVSLPMPRGVDPEGLLAGYFVALEGLPASAVQSVVIKLIRGTWSEPVTFCPRPPELANMVRKEHAAMRERAKPSVPMLAAPHTFKDVRVTQRQRAMELERQDYVFFADCASLDEFARMTRRKELPIGAICLWAIDEIWAPRSAASGFQRPEPSTETEVPAETTIDAEYWRKIQALKDAKVVTDEQAAYRRKISADLDAAQQQEPEFVRSAAE